MKTDDATKRYGSLNTKLNYRTLNIERTLEDIDFLTERLPYKTIDGFITQEQVDILKTIIKNDPFKIHKATLVYKDHWVELVYGYFANKVFLPNVTRHISPVPSGYKIVVD